MAFSKRWWRRCAAQFGWPESNIAEAIETLRVMTELVVPAVILDVVKDDPDDNKILGVCPIGPFRMHCDR